MASRFRFQSRKSSGDQATIGLIIAIAIGFVLCWLPQPGRFLIENFAFWYEQPMPWQVLTYPLIFAGGSFGVIFLIFELFWLFRYGSTIEQRFGKTTLLATFFGSAVAFALCGWIGAKISGLPGGFLDNSWLPTSFLVILVCAMQPNADMCFWGISIKVKWLAALIGAMVLFGYGAGGFPLLGVAVCLPLVFAWYYGQNKIPGITLGKNIFTQKKETIKANREFDEFRSKVRDKEKDRKEKERLRKLFEGSLDDQDPPQSKK